MRIPARTPSPGRDSRDHPDTARDPEMEFELVVTYRPLPDAAPDTDPAGEAGVAVLELAVVKEGVSIATFSHTLPCVRRNGGPIEVLPPSRVN